MARSVISKESEVKSSSRMTRLSGKYMDKMHASHRMGMQNQTFMKVAAIGTWLGDFITAWMVTDMMLQVNETFLEERGEGNQQNFLSFVR